MQKSYVITVITVSLFVCVNTKPLFAEKVLVYDEERGIIFIDSDSLKNNSGGHGSPQSVSQKMPNSKVSRVKPKLRKPTSKNDIHVGRKKDPPELYFKSGLEYFKNHDYLNALKNFQFASRARFETPEYQLWIGKAYRGLEDYTEMLKISLRR